MTLRCTALSNLAPFTPGRDYGVMPGGLNPETQYYDITDDQGKARRFTSKPRKGVRNEYPLSSLWQAFERPASAALAAPLNEFQAAAAAIQAAQAERTLVLTARFGPDCVNQWVSGLKSAGCTEVFPLISVPALNTLLVTGRGRLPAGIYISHLRDVFCHPDGSPTTALEPFDYLYSVT